MPVAKTRLEILQVCKLLQCVRDHDAIQIEKLTISGIPHLINYNEPAEGETAMNIAAVVNNDKMIEFLCDLGGHPDVVDFKGRSAIMRAAEYGHIQCLENLAKHGANMKLTDIDGKGILFYCIAPTQRHQKCAEIAIAFGAEVNNVSNEGEPVFLSICETATDNEAMCLMCLKRGAEPRTSHSKTNRTALMAACASGSAPVVRALLDAGADVNQVMLKTKTHAAHEAAKGGYFDVLVSLAAYGAVFDKVDEMGNTAIHLAAMAGHAMCCKFLSQRGCNPKPKNIEGLVAKVIAKDLGHKEAAKELRKAEKSFGKAGKNNDPWALALYDFCTERFTELLDTFRKLDTDMVGTIANDVFLEALQTAGAPLPDEAADLKKIIQAHERERGILDYSVFLNGKKYINKQYLMSAFEGKKKKGKKGGKKGKKGKTKIPMEICMKPDGPRSPEGGPPAIFIPKHIHFTDRTRFDRDRPPENPLRDDSAWYLDHPEKMYININDAVRHGDIDSLRDNLNLRVNVDIRDKYFKTPLMVACTYGNIKVTQFLVDNGAQVNAEDSFKWTPLHFACHAGVKDVVEFLLDSGAQLEAVTVNGATPIMRAIESSRYDVVQLLLDKGARLQVENTKGDTPVDIATAWADMRVYELIKTKWDSLPKEKKKGANGGKTSGKPSKAAGVDGPKDNAARSHLADGSDSPLLDLLPRPRKGSILRAASALAGGLQDKEDITYIPTQMWTYQPTTGELLQARETRRDRFGWEVDFPDFSMPFLKNVYTKVAEQGGLEDD